MNTYHHLLTYYWRSFVDDKRGTFSKNEGVKVPYEEVKTGRLSTDTLKKLQKKDKLEEKLEYLICPAIWVHEKERNQLITPILIPATIMDQQLLPKENRPPYIGREYLEPALKEKKEAFFVGTVDQQDQFTQLNPYIANEDWTEAWAYAEKLFSSVSEKKWDQLDVKGYLLQKQAWIIPRKEENKNSAVADLYQELLETKKMPPLLENFLSMDEQKRSPLLTVSELADRHVGQMNGKYPLSNGQRESLQHLLSLSSGHILAVNGPPGTGKTTLLQNVVATKWVEAAIAGDQPPIIWATSANNQPIQNIIQSFYQYTEKRENVSKKWTQKIKKLRRRWIPVKSFALYFVAKTKKLSPHHSFQVMKEGGENYMHRLEKGNFHEYKRSFLGSARNYFDTEIASVTEASHLLHRELTSYHQVLQESIVLSRKWEQIKKKIRDIYGTDEQVELADQMLKREHEQQNARWIEAIQLQADWNEKGKIPWWGSFFSFIPFVKEKWRQRARNFLMMLPAHLPFDRQAQSYVEVEEMVTQYCRSVEDDNWKAAEKYRSLIQLLQERDDVASQFKAWLHTHLTYEGEGIVGLEELLTQLDPSLRYLLFLLATHYWEARWLMEMEERQQRKRNGDQRSLTLRENIQKMYYRYAKLTPCFVSTLHILPRKMGVKENKESAQNPEAAENYLYGFIDLLIIDEAGQVTPQLAAPSFALAKNALIVGDTLQIEPISNVSRPIDIGNLVYTRVASDWSKAIKSESLGIMASSGSVMQIAQRRSPYQKNKLFGGMFLSEHRRCLDEIISYCNKLAYEDQLIPMRKEKSQYPFPTMGYAHIVSHVETSGGSKMNILEAETVANWIRGQQQKILNAANRDTSKSRSIGDVVGVVTPFRAQATLIRIFLKEMRITGITVGTVHALQGAERDIILFSPVDTTPGQLCFYDRGINMLNVAVSRARDSFLVFTNWKQFGLQADMPSYLLRQHIPDKNCVHRQESQSNGDQSLIKKMMNRSARTNWSLEEKTIIQQVIHIYSNEGQVNISGGQSTQHSTFHRRN